MACCITAGANDVMEIKTTADLSPSTQCVQNGNVFICKGPSTLFSAGTFAVDPSGKYKLSGSFRAQPGTPPTVFHFGYQPIDKKNRYIMPIHVNAIAKSETELAAPAKPGDLSVKVKDASAWNLNTPHFRIAFKAAPDFSDLPNRDVVSVKKDGIKKVDDSWDISLSEPVRKVYAAGTPIRLTADAGTYIYNVSNGNKTEAEWKTFSGIISGELKNTISRTEWWPGTKSARIVIVLNFGGKDGVTEFKDIKLEKIQ